MQNRRCVNNEISNDKLFILYSELQPKSEASSTSPSKTPIIIAIIVGVLLLIIFIILIFYCCCWRRTRRGRDGKRFCCCSVIKNSEDITTSGGDGDNEGILSHTYKQPDHHELNKRLLVNNDDHQSQQPRPSFQSNECTYYDPSSPTTTKDHANELYESVSDNKPLLGKHNNDDNDDSPMKLDKPHQRRYQDINVARKPVQLPNNNIDGEIDYNDDDGEDYEPVGSPIYKTPSNASTSIYKTPSNASSGEPIYKSPSDVSSRDAHIYKSPSNAAAYPTKVLNSPSEPLYKTPSNASNVGPIYKTPSNASSNNAPIYKSPSNDSSCDNDVADTLPTYKSPSNASADPLRPSIPGDGSVPNKSGYQVPKKKYQDVHSRAVFPSNNNNTSLLPENQNINSAGVNGDSAVYTNVKDDDKTIYKTPSNAPKYQTPKKLETVGIDVDDSNDDHDYELPPATSATNTTNNITGSLGGGDGDQIYQNVKQIQ